MPGREQAEYILFVRDRDPARETWMADAQDPTARRANMVRTMRFRLRTWTTSFPA